jgi:hypothetical protein
VQPRAEASWQRACLGAVLVIAKHSGVDAASPPGSAPSPAAQVRALVGVLLELGRCVLGWNMKGHDGMIGRLGHTKHGWMQRTAQ